MSDNKIVNEQRDFTRNIKTALEWKNYNDITRKKKVSGIYKIVNKVNGKYYIGSTNYFWNRHRQHLIMLKEQRHTNPHLQNAFNKYGPENFIFQVIEKVPEDQLIQVEQKYLDIAKAESDKTYNQNWVAEKMIFTPEVRAKLSKALTGKKVSEETKRRISERTKEAMFQIRYEFVDKTIHKFYNETTHETFEGYGYDFQIKYGLSNYTVRRLIRGIRNHAGGRNQWILIS